MQESSDRERVAQLLREAREYTQELGSLLSGHLDANNVSPLAKIPYKARILREALLHRAWELADAACENFEQGRVITAFVLTRAAFETAALVFVLHKRVAKVVDVGSLGEFDEGFLMRALFGRKDDQGLPYQAFNILTCIDHIDRHVTEGREDRRGAVMALFADLCEYAHPNWAGTMGAYTHDVDERHSEFGSGKGNPPAECGIRSLRIALSIVIGCHRKLTELEDPLRELCERESGQ